MPIHDRCRRVASLVIWCAVAVLLNIGGSLAAQQVSFSYATFSFPGASATTAFGINSRGDIVGTYRDASGKTHGFVRRDEMFTSIDYPEAVLTQARGISLSGDVVGAYRLAGEPDVNAHGYLRTALGRFGRVDIPGHTSSIAVRRLADGTIVGCYHDGDQMNTMHGMKLAGQTLLDLDRPTSMHTGGTPDGKTVVGFYTDMSGGNRGRGYVLEGSTFTPLDVPGSAATSAQDINASGVIVGVYQVSGGSAHGFVREDSAYTTLEVPGSSETRAFGINDIGTIVGSFVDTSSTTQGFVATRR